MNEARISCSILMESAISQTGLRETEREREREREKDGQAFLFYHENGLDPIDKPF